MWLYRRGMMRAKFHKHDLAIVDYSAVIDMPGVPADIRAMAFYNRALVHHATACESAAIDDLTQVIEIDDIADNLKTEARRKLIRMQRAPNRPNEHERFGDSHSQGRTDVRAEPETAAKHTH
jgi:hypothetical protein